MHRNTLKLMIWERISQTLANVACSAEVIAQFSVLFKTQMHCMKLLIFLFLFLLVLFSLLFTIFFLPKMSHLSKAGLKSYHLDSARLSNFFMLKEVLNPLLKIHRTKCMGLYFSCSAFTPQAMMTVYRLSIFLHLLNFTDYC